MVHKVQLSNRQQDAVDRVMGWYVLGSGGGERSAIFRLFGYAGTGKTELASRVADAVTGALPVDGPEVPGEGWVEFGPSGGQAPGGVAFATYTGKASSVLGRRLASGGRLEGATTLHRLIYRPRGEARARLDAMQRELDGLRMKFGKGAEEYRRDVKERVKFLKTEISKEKAALRNGPSFTLNMESELRNKRLLIVDEVSMVDEKMMKDLLSFGTPILALGDPAQLPPVGGEGAITRGDPDVLLTEIHRHEGGIVEAATVVRGEGRLPRGTRWEGDGSLARTVRGGEITLMDALEYDQVIVGMNKTRWARNERIRGALGMHGIVSPGEKIICTANNYEFDVINGEQYIVREVNGQPEDDGYVLTIEDDLGGVKSIPVWAHGFSQKGEKELKDLPYHEVNRRGVFTYGYAITCHKAQGSQWGRVLVVDESAVFRGEAGRWLYTALTRAEKEATVITSGGRRVSG